MKGAGLSVVFALLALGTRAAGPLALDSQPLLFVDDTPIAAQRGLTRSFHPARTRAAPVLQPDRPWEGNRVYVYGSVHRDEASGQFWLWYMGNSPQTAGAPAAPKLRRGGQNLVLFATSKDGLTWEKPALGLHEYAGSTANNIVFDAQSPAVVVDRFERDPARRFKLLTYFHGGYLAAFSADGRRWTEFPKNPVFEGGDTMSMTQDPRSGEFLAYFKKPDTRVPGRLVWLTRSRDFRTWSAPKLVFHADAEDNRWATNPDQRTEVYDMTVLPHAGGFVGLPAMFRVVSRTDKSVKLPAGQSGHDGPIDIQLATSTDGERWQRPTTRVNMIPRGAPGTFDGGTILGLSSNAIEVGDETWLYYTAINTGHGAPMPPKRITLGRAAWRRHGFASLDAAAAGGQLDTVPLRFTAPQLVLNADATGGEARVALLEADGRAIAGRALADCTPLRADATHWTVRWRDGAAVPTDRAVRLRIALTDACLFSLSAGREISGHD
ncbi:MAG: hypothetical protein HZA93_19285 [Verrucomicrobia bacterium]|nr:hypothetical protein [Verrucomicrobiota bacterium]